MDSTQTVPHPEKTCDPCGAKFTPGSYLTAAQAAEVRSCSHGCASARANGGSVGPGKRNGGDAADTIGTLDADGRCICADCKRIASEDRAPLIARIASERGMGIASGPRPRLGPAALSSRAARIRRHRLENYDPVYVDGNGGDFETGEL